jgi:hypothetical protein
MIFLGSTYQSMEKIYQMSFKLSDAHKNTHHSKILLMTRIFDNIFHFKALQYISKIGIFGLKRNHLATLVLCAILNQGMLSLPPKAQPKGIVVNSLPVAVGKNIF